MRRRISFFLLFIFSFGVIIYFYVNNIFIPVTLKKIIANKAEEYLQRDVTVGKITFDFLKGFTLQNVKVYKKDSHNKLFFSAEELSCKLFFYPTLKDKRVIISGLKIKDPLIYVSLDKENQFNFTDIFKHPDKTAEKSPIKYYLTKLSLENGDILFSDESGEEPFTEQISNLQVKTSFALNQTLPIFCEAYIPRKESYIKLEGYYSLKTKTLKANVSANNIFLAKYLSVFYKHSATNLKEGILSVLNGQFTAGRQKLSFIGDYSLRDLALKQEDGFSLSGKINAHQNTIIFSKNSLNLKGEITLSSANIQIDKTRDLSGDFSLNLSSLETNFEKIRTSGSLSIHKGALTLDSENTIKADLLSSDFSLSHQDKTLNIAGSLQLENSSIKNKDILKAAGNISATNLLFKIENGRISFSTDLSSADARFELPEGQSLKASGITSKIIVKKNGEASFLKAKGSLADAELNTVKNIIINANPGFDVKIPLPLKNGHEKDYLVSLNFQNAKVSGIKNLGEISAVSGRINIGKDILEAEHLKGKMSDTDLELSGTMQNFQSPVLELNTRFNNIRFDDITPFFKDTLKSLAIDVHGVASGEFNYKGSASTLSGSKISVKGKINNTTLSVKKDAFKATAISGDITYENDLLGFDNITAIYEGITYALSGQIKDFSRPILDLSISSEKLKASSQIKILKQAFSVTSLSGNYQHSSFDLRGEIHLNKDTLPDFNLKGQLGIASADVANLKYPFIQNFAKMNPKGFITVENLIFRGNPSDWRNWQLTFNANAPSFSLLNYTFHNSSFNFSLRDQNVSQCSLESTLYNGKIAITASADLTKKAIPFQASASLDSLNMAEMRKDKKIKIPGMKGMLSVDCVVSGSSKDPLNLTGKGSFNTKDAYLGEIEIIKGLLSTINRIPGFLGNLLSTIAKENTSTISEETKNYITDIRGDFAIRDKKISTDNTRLFGSLYDLKIVGSVSMDKKINLIAMPDYNRFTGKSRNATEFIGSPVQIKITGSLDKPQYKPIIDPTKPIEDAVGTTIDLLKEVGGIFQGMIK